MLFIYCIIIIDTFTYNPDKFLRKSFKCEQKTSVLESSEHCFVDIWYSLHLNLPSLLAHTALNTFGAPPFSE